MNALCYKIVFSKRLGALVAVGEHTVGQGKTASGSGVRSVVNDAISSFIGALSAVFAAVALTFLTVSFTASVGFAAAPATNALPSGASVNSGSVAISSTSSSNAAVMNITQTTDKASVNWQSFNIGSAARVNVQQNSASSVLLNRVVGNDPSQIFGKLSANGQVILINPNGIVFGSGGSVTASAFTASTFGINEQDFASGKYKYTRSGSTAGVTVQDGATLNATAPGGYIALIGASVDNQGRISTKQGAVVLAAGESITLPAGLTNNISVPLSGKVRLELLPSTINAMVANSGTITTEGGQVLMQAAALSDAVASITHTGTIDTTGDQGGAVDILADHGQIRVSGSITANSNAAGHKGGDIIIGRDLETDVLAKVSDVSGAELESLGGFVETSGDELKFEHVIVMAKDWLLDPVDVVINAASAATIGSNLGTTNVTIQTTGPTLGTTSTGTGNITINSAITKAAAAGAETTLTLLADNGIIVNAAIGAATGAGKLNVVMTANGQTDAVALGSMTTAQRAASRGIFINNTSINANGGDVTLTGTSYANVTHPTNGLGKGVQIHNGGRITARNINITGTAENQSGNTSYGVVFQRYAPQATLTATGDITISGTVKGTGSGSGFYSAASGWGAQAPMITAGGKFTLTGNTESTSNTSAAIDNQSGMQVRAVGDITVKANTNNAAVDAINFSSGSAATWGGALSGNTSFRSINGAGAASGNVLIQSNQGSIRFNNALPSHLTSGSLTALTDITGKNVVIDNTGAGMVPGSGSIDSTGAITAGSGGATGGASGVNLDGRKITATGNLNIMGVAKGTGSGVQSNAVLKADGAVNLTGKSNGGYGAVVQGTVTAKNDINLYGESSNTNSFQGLLIQNAVISNDGNIAVTGQTNAALQRALAITVNGTNNGNLKVADGKKIDINANTLFINSASSVDAGSTGTVSIKTLTSGNEILIGGPGASDVMSTSLANQKLGIDNTELNRITAGKLVIGNTSSAGVITVSAATTTNATTGNVTLQTGGNIAVNAALTVGDAGATRNLTLNGAGTTSAITQASTSMAAIKAAGLELLGTNATHTLNNAGNDIKKLAGDTKTVSLTNNQAFAIDTVMNTAGLTTSGNTTLNSTAAVTQTAAIKSAGLELLGAGGSYTLNNSGNTVQKLAGNTGTVSLTNQGNLTVGVVNATTGLTAANDIKLTTTTATGTALTISNDIKSANGDVSLIAVTSDTNSAPNAAVLSEAHVQGRDVTMSAKAQGLSGRTLGYRGTTTGKFTASRDLKLSGSTQNEASGFYMYGGALSAGNTLSIEGTSAQGQGVGFDKASTSPNVSITSVNGITIKGTASNSTSSVPQAAINLKDVDLTNNVVGAIRNASAVTLEAVKGDITTSGTGTLTQSGNGGVKLTTVDAGNITVPKIINNGTDNVVIAAGSNLAVGDGTGGQVKTVTGNTITQTATGKTYIYSGNANDTGSLSAVGGFANGLFLSTIGSDIVNAASNTEYKTSGTQNTIAGGATTQVMFREKVALTGAFNNATVTYGDSTNSTAVKAALQATNPASGSSNIISTTSNAGIFKILNADFFADMASGKPSVDTALSLATNKSTSGNLKANSAGYNVDIAGTKYTLSTTAKLVVNQKSLTALYAANDKVFDGNTNATVVGSLQNTITGDLVNPTHTSATFDTFAVGTSKTVTVTGISLSGVDLANYKIDPVANPTFTATARAAITPSAPTPPAPVVPTNATNGRVKIPLSAANPFQLASAEELGGEDFCQNTSIDPLKGESSGNSTSSCTCEESKLAQDAQICFETNTQKVSLQ
jgi:filamentous hemagglutinin family protein